MLSTARKVFDNLLGRNQGPVPATPLATLGLGPVQLAPQTRVFNGEPTPRYPGRGNAIPAAPPEYLLESQDGLIRQLRQTLGTPREEFAQLVMPVLLRFANFVHLLPASESHHHCGQGGLLRHGLEVAFFSARLGEGMVFATDRD